ncbi:hypothetical protein [Photorhabdus cinerea]|uniref:Uncharacterized protein n=1 Tax=Photorhabdus cinerea TaxID=471575 RepID=A0A7X5TGU7_9GAMM|nr:hypothetical protein [Photorhabdus cinerea]NHB93151.1 hypothetical protein [Photorhabdus cinerea]
MNLEALRYLVEKKREIIESSAIEHELDEKTVYGIASFVLENGTDKLSSRQLYNFNKAILPLIENLCCTGHSIGEEHTTCNFLLPDSQLYEYYAYDETLCKSCQSEVDYYNYGMSKASKPD